MQRLPSFRPPRTAAANKVIAAGQPFPVDPLSTEKGSTLDAYMAGRPNPFGHRRSRAKGWSTYGAQRAQPVATGGKWDTLENGSNKPIGNPWQPTATVPERMVSNVPA
jgi:hypothetical protein